MRKMAAIKLPYIGAHVSANGGFGEALVRAEAMGATAMQIFGSSPRMWRARMPLAADARAFKAAYEKSTVKGLYLHAAYLVNVASSSPTIYNSSIQSLIDHLSIVEAIGGDGLIFHIGSSKGGTREEALAKEIMAIKKVLHAVPGKAKLLMENTAGGGEKIGVGIDEMAQMFNEVNSERLKICFDTAHAFEAGAVSAYTKESVKSLFNAWDKAIGVENIEVIHANDSKTESGSHHDRHENIGAGFIGLDGFKALAGDKRLRDKAWILEVPGFHELGPDKENIDILKSCFK